MVGRVARKVNKAIPLGESSWAGGAVLTDFLSPSFQDYELEAEKLRSILDLENGRNGFMNKRPRLQSPATKVKEEVR